MGFLEELQANVAAGASRLGPGRLPVVLGSATTVLAVVCTLVHQPFMEADIARRTSLALGAIAGLEEVEVRAEKGRDVVLTGVVARERLVRTAVLAAERVDGVRRVTSDLEVTPVVGKEVPATPMALAALRGDRPFQEAAGRVSKLDALEFEPGSATLSGRDRGILDEVVRILGVRQELDLEISGGLGHPGAESLDPPLRRDRVDAVRDYLTRALDPGRIFAVEPASGRLAGGTRGRPIEFRVVERSRDGNR